MWQHAIQFYATALRQLYASQPITITAYLHVLGSFLSSHFIILGLFGPVQCMPLDHTITQSNKHWPQIIHSLYHTSQTYHLAQDLVNSSTLFQSTLLNHVSSLLLHEQHECIQRLFNVRLFLLHLRCNHSTRIRLHRSVGSYRLTQGCKLYMSHMQNKVITTQWFSDNRWADLCLVRHLSRHILTRDGHEWVGWPQAILIHR